MRYCDSSGLMAVARLASKSRALKVCLGSATLKIARASCREYRRRLDFSGLAHTHRYPMPGFEMSLWPYTESGAGRELVEGLLLFVRSGRAHVDPCHQKPGLPRLQRQEGLVFVAPIHAAAIQVLRPKAN